MSISQSKINFRELLKRPVCFLGLGFGSGLAPKAPGTFGTIAAIPVYLLILNQFNQVFFFTIMFVLIFFTHRENIKRLKNKEETKTKIY